MASRKFPKLKELDDVLGGAAAWENVDATEGVSVLFDKIILLLRRSNPTTAPFSLKVAETYTVILHI